MAVVAMAAAVCGCGREAMTDMAYASLDGMPAPRRMRVPGEPSGEAAEWFECADDPTWFTNSVGERISVERYCAIVNVEDGQAAERSFDSLYRRCDEAMTRRLAEFYSGEACAAHDAGNGEVVACSDAWQVYRSWQICDGLYLLFVEDNSGRMQTRSYVAVMSDSVVLRCLVEFDCQPSDEQLKNAALARTNAAALNNIAVMIDRDEANRRAADAAYIVKLLEMAAAGGEPQAGRNLAFRDRRDGNAVRSGARAGLTGTVARRKGRKPGAGVPSRPLVEWPFMNDSPVGGEEKSVEAYLTALLTSLGFDCGGGAKRGAAERRYFQLKGYESVLLFDDPQASDGPDEDSFRAVCRGPCNIQEAERSRANELVARLNAHSTDVRFRFDGSDIWCECTLSVKTLRQMKSRTEQCAAVVRMLTVTANGIQSNKAALSALQTASD